MSCIEGKSASRVCESQRCEGNFSSFRHVYIYVAFWNTEVSFYIDVQYSFKLTRNVYGQLAPMPIWFAFCLQEGNFTYRHIDSVQRDIKNIPPCNVDCYIDFDSLDVAFVRLNVKRTLFAVKAFDKLVSHELLLWCRNANALYTRWSRLPRNASQVSIQYGGRKISLSSMIGGMPQIGGA